MCRAWVVLALVLAGCGDDSALREELRKTKAELESVKTRAQDMVEKQNALSRNAHEMREMTETRLVQMSSAYAALYHALGIHDARLYLTESAIPKPEVIRGVVRDYLVGLAEKLRESSEVQLDDVPHREPPPGVFLTRTGNTFLVRLCDAWWPKKAEVTVRSLLDPLPGQFAYAARLLGRK